VVFHGTFPLLAVNENLRLGPIASYNLQSVALSL
jgi:hypothetical protein